MAPPVALRSLVVAAAVIGGRFAAVSAAAEPPAVQFEAPVAFDTGEAGPADVERADFNNDGLLDVAVLTTVGGARVHFLLGDGAGWLLKDNTLDVAYASGLTSGDFDGD